MPHVKKTGNPPSAFPSTAQNQEVSVKKNAGRTVKKTKGQASFLKSLWLDIVNFFSSLKIRLIKKTEPTVSIKMDGLGNETQTHLCQAINALATGNCEQFLASTTTARKALMQKTAGRYDLGTYIGEITKLLETIKGDQNNYNALIKQLSSSSSKLHTLCGVMEYIGGDVQNWSSEEGTLISLAYAITSVVVEELAGAEQAQALSKSWGESVIDNNTYQEVLSQIPRHLT
ncbi:MAG: hypothetical protein B0D91_06265 [Oceanospirillales bacterium LUC14_002_19_P2]|nr:MAG: hypothetical protein B0D91_06265 [Oceanospirillales bacterium LUC14_002_19_P2]